MRTTTNNVPSKSVRMPHPLRSLNTNKASARSFSDQIAGYPRCALDFEAAQVKSGPATGAIAPLASQCPLWVRSGRVRCQVRCPRWTRSGLMQCSKKSNYSITSSAATSRPGGNVRPSAFAVLRLRIVSNFVGACTGSSAGLLPRSMRST